jgi:A/G-specific adenine glycosylase
MAPVIHGFTHFELHLVPLRLRIPAPAPVAGETGLQWLPLADAHNAALPAPVRRLLGRTDIE